MIPKKMATPQTDIRDFLEYHPVFTLEEFRGRERRFGGADVDDVLATG